ncbi:hypothetical protein AJ80_01139 [Polytolypa hystricis UAMH7299]|uniref:Uncharacterized protein n=1 Tax=Polytolypa hystricis (strain UAMH7299) TaxID=1447883 RepID=A0A2B7Z286_POLH7|nr:hypothetical protein AJ80_01139 [Polytolypa hystricis UAMH7299]
MADYRTPPLQLPHRKPLPTGNAGLQFYSSGSPTQYHHPHPPPPQQQHLAQQQVLQQHRPRTASSSFLPPSMVPPTNPGVAAYPQQQQQQINVSVTPVRRLSNATTSTTSTGGNGFNSYPRPHMQSDIRRSSSSRSTSPQVGYVALMRKQKGTVWCDRAQPEDPRAAAQRRAAKHRALMEVNGVASGRNSTLVSSGKIRHNTASRSMTYNTGTMVGTGVPLRLSANEVGSADDGLEDRGGDALPANRRTGSGRSSAGSSRFPSGYQRPQQGRFSTSSTPPSLEGPDGRGGDIPEIVETPAPTSALEEDAYFAGNKSASGSLRNPDTSGSGSAPASVPAVASASASAVAADTKDRPGTAHSFSSEGEDNFGSITDMAAPSGAVLAAQNAKKNDDLRRRGSVDDRTTTMTGQRLFVANPDLSD